MSKTPTKTKAPSMVRVHNRTAGRPLLFRVSGRDVRLGPGESEVLQEQCLNGHELKSLCEAGLVNVAPEKPARKKGSGAKPPRKTSGVGKRTRKRVAKKAARDKASGRKSSRSSSTGSGAKKARTR